jgi:hypothetical protein
MTNRRNGRDGGPEREAQLPMNSVTDNRTAAVKRREAAWLRLSDERAAWLARVLRSHTVGYDFGYEDGYRAGREAEAAERDLLWNEIARPIAQGRPSHAELQARRYGRAS